MATTAQPHPDTNSKATGGTMAKAWGVKTAGAAAEPLTIERRTLRAEDVAIEISHCGICHSDLHMARNDWGMSLYPMVPGHEIVGTVTAVGSGVSKYRVGNRVAVGCLVDSDLSCDQCKDGHEQFCAGGATRTESGIDRQDGTLTQGGYS